MASGGQATSSAGLGPEAFERDRKLWQRPVAPLTLVRTNPKRASTSRRLWRLFCFRHSNEEQTSEQDMLGKPRALSNGGTAVVFASEVSGTEGSTETETGLSQVAAQRQMRAEIESMLESPAETFTFSEPVPLSLLIEVLAEARDIMATTDDQFHPFEFL
ncbi:hypothetical protein F1559_000695 [Cyanidiococcus yangmingshanensis]|uniref:Uncharacterized protein n=1 Tax=Cyanidiococcus yangmingshanensis TaxID=2690220 RepID=A0A7J7IC45_9RHOD|nr:hypothetical protein F1559_000695 [Cyanidiococcus yangmingshanensis]